MTELLTDRVGGTGLEVRFDRVNDRYEHTVTLLNGAARHRLLTTVSGEPTSDWPASPPFQQILLEARDPGPVALLVGMAGKSHWSASIDCQSGIPAVTFDVACHARQTPDWLGTTYRCETAPRRACDRALVWETDAVTARLSSVEVDGLQPRLEQQADSMTIDCVIDHQLVPPRTWRWKYVLAVVTDPG